MELDMLSAVRSRTKSYGISTAAPFLRNVEQCLGGSCPSKLLEGVSEFRWQQALKNAEKQLVYHHPEMDFAGDFIKAGGVTELPPHTIAHFPATITTTRQDRDGDVLETKGAQLDPKAPLLWQHLPFEPIGKLLKQTKHTNKLLAGDFSICGTPLGEDAAMLAEHGALRISHGFTTDDFEPLDDKEYEVPGFHVYKFTIMEISLVSIPSNVDAELTAFSRDKLHHPLVKAMAAAKFDARPVVSAVGIDLSALPAGTSVTFSKAAEGVQGAPIEQKAASCGCGGKKSLAEQDESKDAEAKPYSFRVEASGRVAIIRREDGKVVAHADSMEEAHEIAHNREMFNHMNGHGKAVTPGDPMTGWHACRVENPDKFETDSFRTMKQEDKETGKPVEVIIGKLKDGDGKTSTQAIRYPMTDWTAAEAKKRCATHDGAKFTAGKEEEKKGAKCIPVLSEPIRYKGRERDFYNPETGSLNQFDIKGVYVEFENSFDDIRCDLNDALLPFLMLAGEADADDFCYIVDLFLYQALVQVCERSYFGPYPGDYCYPVSDDEACYYMLEWEMGPDGEPVWSGTPQSVEVTPEIKPLAERAFNMLVKSLPAAHLRKMKKAMGHMANVMGQDDAPAPVKSLAEKAHSAIKSVHDAHAEKAALSNEHAKLLTKAMSYMQKGMDHKDASEDAQDQFSKGHAAVKGVMDDMSMSGEESLENIISKAIKAGRKVSAANEAKIKAAGTFYKAIANDDEADSDVKALAINGYQAVTDIFETGGDSASDYDQEGNYTGNDVHANMANGQSTNLPDGGGAAGKAGRSISKETGAKVQKAIEHGKAIVAHEKATDVHRTLATKAVNKLKSVLGEETPHEQGDDNSMNLVTQDQPAKSLNELCAGNLRNALTDYALTGNLSELEKHAAVLTEAGKSAKDTITRIERQRQYDAELAEINEAAASI